MKDVHKLFPHAKHHHNIYIRWHKKRQEWKTFPKKRMMLLWKGLDKVKVRYWKNVLTYLGDSKYTWLDAVFSFNGRLYAIKLRDTSNKVNEDKTQAWVFDEMERRKIPLMYWYHQPHNYYEVMIFLKKWMKEPIPSDWIIKHGKMQIERRIEP